MDPAAPSGSPTAISRSAVLQAPAASVEAAGASVVGSAEGASLVAGSLDGAGPADEGSVLGSVGETCEQFARTMSVLARVIVIRFM